MFSISVKGLVLPLVTWGETTYMGESINLKIRYLNWSHNMSVLTASSLCNHDIHGEYYLIHYAVI